MKSATSADGAGGEVGGAAREGGARPEPLGFVGADRPCVGCGFNLRGQAIARESHYGLALARCPECGRADALMELPRLARWQGRVALLLTGAWLGAMLLGLLVTFGLMSNATYRIRMRLADPFNVRIIDAYKAADPANAQSLYYGEDAYLPSNWQSLIDIEAMAKELPDPLLEMRAKALLEVLLSMTYLVPLGMCWGVALGWRRRGQVVAAMVVMTVVGIAMYYAMYVANSGPNRVRFGGWSSDAAMAQLGPRLFIPCVLVVGVSLVVGAWFGKPVARLLVLLLIPPAARAPLSFLWYIDGKPLPSVAGGGSGSGGATSAARSS